MADKELTEKDKDDLRKLYKKAVMTGWLVQEDLEKSAEEKKKNEQLSRFRATKEEIVS
jgi:hypothetical protein